MKLSTKLIFSFSVVILLVGGIGLISSYTNEAVKDQVTAESRQAIKEVELAGEMGLQLYQSLTRTQYLLENQYRQSLSTNYSRGDRSRKILIEDIDEALQNFRNSLGKIREVVKKNSPVISTDTAGAKSIIGLLDKLEKKFSIYTSLLKQFQTLSSGSYEDSKEFFTVTIEPYFRTNMLPLIDQIRQKVQQNHEQKIAGLNRYLNRVGYGLIIGTFFALAAALSVTFFLYRSIANPVQKIAEAAKSIGRGNLNERIGYQSSDELGELSNTFDRMAENLSQTTVSRDYIDSIIEAMEDLLIVTDTDNNITRVNSAGIAMLGISEDDLLGKKADTIFRNLSQPILGQEADQNINSCNAELDSGDEAPVSISKGSILDRDGNIDGYVIVASDISSEKKAQKKIAQSLREKEVLLAEIHHRVKNNLAVISGLLQMQMWDANNDYAVSALQQSHLRVRSIALVHEQLYQSESLSYIEFDTYIRDLLEAIQDTYLSDESDIQITTDLERVILNVNQAIPCSLLINELVINAFQHAFEEGDEGTIEVALSRLNGQVMLKVKDNGKGFPDIPSEEGHSEMTLVHTLTKQLSGDIVFQNDKGANITVTFETKEKPNTAL